MASMVEKVARAICKKHGVDPDGHRDFYKADDTLMRVRGWESEVPAARAALETLKEPTPEMVDAGYDAVDLGPGPDGGLYCDPKVQWIAMITAALEDQ